VEERFVAVARTNHPLFRRPFTPEEGAALPRIHVAPRGGTHSIAERRARSGGSKNVRLFVPHYAAVPWVLTSTQLVAALPERVATRFAEQFPLRTAPLPGPAATLKLHQVWHPRAHEDPAHRWLRTETLRCARAIGAA
jgi:DNA-binding transcriptional LysR family regulator